MTEGQTRFQTLMEDQRHNLEVERINRGELKVHEAQQRTREDEQALKQRQLDWDIQLADYTKPAERAKNIGGAFGAFAKGIKDIVGAVSGVGALFG